MKNKIVKITHRDLTTVSAQEGLAWHSKEQLIKAGDEDFNTEYYAIGVIVHQTKDYVLVAPNFCGDRYSDVSMLPKGIIIKIEELK